MTINLREIPALTAPINLTLDDAFFASLDQDEIHGGEVNVTLKVDQRAGDAYRFAYHIEGTVRVTCDRCLEDVSMPVDFDDVIFVAHGDSEDDNGETLIIPFSQLTYENDWDMYELINVHLPIQHVHPEGECNPDMISRFSSEEDSENDEF